MKRRQRPNILFIMADQLAAPVLPSYGGRQVIAPFIESLASRGVVFSNAYCNFPICAPSRFSMLSGRLPMTIDAFDNASEFPAGVPTIAHYLAMTGYRTTLCGKMHFVGPDQMHGFEDRLVTDIYPADFTWTPDWREGPASVPTGISVRVVREAGHCIRSLQIDYDDEVAYFGRQKIYDLARDPGDDPFFLTVSFTHPHSPYTAPRRFWDWYDHASIEMPVVGPIDPGELDVHSRWLYHSHGRDRYRITEEHVRNARHAYYGMVSYVDERVGEILGALEETGLDENTIVVFAADHGEMLGERGMWFKQTFFEWSSRVPLIVSWPGRVAPGRREEVVSLVDLAPTLLDLAAPDDAPEPDEPFDGHSLKPLLEDEITAWPDIAISEYTDMGVSVPCRMVRQGRYKYIYTHGYPGQLFDLERDPNELDNLAGYDALADTENELRQQVLQGWDPDEIDRRVRASQRRRMVINQAAQRSGRFPNWSYVVRPGDERRFVRGSGKTDGAAGTKARARFPFVSPEG